ncbi:MAG TPA: FAD-dependent oxidoreductase, partial [Candidatus Goldiibacteriota bacterium]|nr:FAD-dependent oxidoreductase [Candidatus Goldiibacteriota bacterium]
MDTGIIINLGNSAGESVPNKADVIIIGGGPAGLTAAIYNCRAGLKVMMIEKMAVGGQIFLTAEIENYPGYENISGPELIENMRKQAERFGTQFVMKDVTAVNLGVYPFRITAEDTEYSAKSLIIATGAKAKYLDHPSVERFKGKGISACATCDGFFFRDSIVFVIGGGDTAAEEALFLAKFAKEVTIVHRRDKLRTEKYVQEKLSNNPK